MAEKKYLVVTNYKDFSRQREVLTLEQIQDKLKTPPFAGSTISIEEL